jgi:hypothetical protein
MFANKSFFELFGCSLTHACCLVMYDFTLIQRNWLHVWNLSSGKRGVLLKVILDFKAHYVARGAGLPNIVLLFLLRETWLRLRWWWYLADLYNVEGGENLKNLKNLNHPATIIHQPMWSPFLIGPQFMGWMGGLGNGLGF